MKHLFALCAFLVPALSFAYDTTSAELMQTLIENSSKIRLEGSVNTDDSIASLLAQTFAQQTMVDEGKSVVLNSVSSKCTKTGSSAQGTRWSCTLTILDGDYRKTSSGYSGPELESSTSFTFETTRTTEQSCRGCRHSHQLKGTTVRIDIAG